MILVTGAGGTTGRLVLDLLRERHLPVRAMTRRADPPPGWVTADFDDPGSLAEAAAGVDAIYLVTVPGTPTPRHDEALLTAAVDAGVRHVVKLSAIGTGERAEGGVLGAWHLAAETLLRDSGTAWTVLRPTVFASNTLAWADAIRAGQPVPNVTGAGASGVIDPADIAAVAVAALTEDQHHGHMYVLTGPDLLTVPEQAAVLAGVLGRPVSTTDVPVEAVLAQPGLDPAAAEAMGIGLRYARAGRNAIVTGDVERILGRPAGTFHDWAVRHRGAFTG